MPALLLLSIPYLLAVIAVLILSGPAIRPGVIGIVLVALSTVAASRVPVGTPSFRAINNVMLVGGMLLFIAATALALKGGRPVPAVPVPGPPEDTAPRSDANLRRWGMPVLLGLLLVPSLWFVITVAGPDAWSLEGLRDAPFSAAGETLLASLLLPASLVLAGVWPFGILTDGPRFAPLAALLLLVIVVPMAGGGLEHWRSLYAGWLVLSAFVAAAGANWPRLMACAGLFALACGGQTSWWAGVSLTLIASLLSLRPATSGPLLRLFYLTAGMCGMAALQSTLSLEVVYSVLMVFAVVVAALRTSQRAVVPA